MPYGFQSLMPNGSSIQIDDTIQCYVFKGKYTLPGGRNNLDVPGLAGTAILAFGGDSHAAIGAIRNVGAWTVYSDGPVDCYVFDRATAPSAHGWGLQVFAANGAVAYDSGLEIMQVVTAFNAPNGDQRGYNEWGFGLPAGRYAIAPCGGCTAMQFSSQGGIAIFSMDTYRVTANAAYVKLAPVAQRTLTGGGANGIRFGTVFGPIVTVIDISRLG